MSERKTVGQVSQVTDVEDPKGDEKTAPVSLAPATKPGPADHLKQYQWKKGQAPPSGPGPGRPKALATRVAAMTDNGNELLRIWLEIARTGRSERDRLTATQHLADRLWGKAVETSVLLKADLGSVDDVNVTSDALEMLARAIRRPALPPTDQRTIVEGEVVESSAGSSAVVPTLEPAKVPETLDE